jgi:hypothetical protein
MNLNFKKVKINLNLLNRLMRKVSDKGKQVVRSKIPPKHLTSYSRVRNKHTGTLINF